jgi:hypothetical protein
MLTQAELKRLFYYHPESGDFVRLVRTANCNRVGDQAGWQLSEKSPYLVINVAGTEYLAHRLAYFYMTGTWVEFIDHEDTVKHHNWWSNLRPASKPQNSYNRGPQANNAIGHKNITQRRDRFHVNIVVAGKKKFLGSFKSLDEALAKRDSCLLGINDFQQPRVFALHPT